MWGRELVLLSPAVLAGFLAEPKGDRISDTTPAPENLPTKIKPHYLIPSWQDVKGMQSQPGPSQFPKSRFPPL